jgi:hypothetical protein
MTREDLLGDQRRAGTPIRSSFPQERGGDRAAGPMHHFVRERRLLALQLYLLLHCVAQAEPWDVWLPAMAWARALDKTKPGAEATISRNWAWLAQHQLVRSERDKRLRRVYLLEEDGSGNEYERPTGNFFMLPLAFFGDEWHQKLSLAGTAALLIGLNSRPVFQLRKEHAAGWFGVSADTLQRGLDELRDYGLLAIEQRRIAAPRTRQGWTVVNEYGLLAPFAKAIRPTDDDNAEPDQTADLPVPSIAADRTSPTPTTTTRSRP